MNKFFSKLKDIFGSKSLRKKIYFTLLMLVIYRLLVMIPVPVVNIDFLMNNSMNGGGGLGFFLMMLGGSMKNFSIIAAGLSPYINASIILQLLAVIIPSLADLKEEGEVGQIKMQQYTKYLTVPLAFVQGIGMLFFINNLLQNKIDINLQVVLLAGFVMMVGTMMLVWLGELITEKGISNGISLLIFSSIIAGIVQHVLANVSATENLLGLIIFMLILVLGLIILSILILKSVKEIPVMYATRGKIQESSILPIPLNPVGMIPIIFAMAFASFPYLITKLMLVIHPGNEKIVNLANWIQLHLNIYSQQPSVLTIFIYFVLIVIFTYFYTLIVFSPQQISDDLQKRGGYIPGIRPGKETANYLNDVLMHLCFWGGMGLGVVGIYSYVLYYLPFIKSIVQSIGSLPMVVTGSGIIIIVGVVQELINKIEAELLMVKYEKML